MVVVSLTAELQHRPPYWHPIVNINYLLHNFEQFTATLYNAVGIYAYAHVYGCSVR